MGRAMPDREDAPTKRQTEMETVRLGLSGRGLTREPAAHLAVGDSTMEHVGRKKVQSSAIRNEIAHQAETGLQGSLQSWGAAASPHIVWSQSKATAYV